MHCSLNNVKVDCQEIKTNISENRFDLKLKNTSY